MLDHLLADDADGLYLLVRLQRQAGEGLDLIRVAVAGAEYFNCLQFGAGAQVQREPEVAVRHGHRLFARLVTYGGHAQGVLTGGHFREAEATVYVSRCSPGQGLQVHRGVGHGRAIRGRHRAGNGERLPVRC